MPVIRAKENLLAKIGLNIEVNDKRPKQQWFDTLDCWMEISKPRDYIEIRPLIEQKCATDHHEPILLMNGTKTKEKEDQRIEKGVPSDCKMCTWHKSN